MSSIPTALEQPDEHVLGQLRGIPCAVLCDAMHALGMPNSTLSSSIRHIAGPDFVGRARTIERMSSAANGRQGDFNDTLTLGTQQVIDSLSPDSVLVIGIDGDTTGAIWGANMATRAVATGAVAVVTDGAVRDVSQMEEIGISVFAQASSPRVNFSHLITRSIDQPVVCGGVLVRPGDIVKGDRDGVVVIPAERAGEVMEKATAVQRIEDEMLAFISAGNSLVAAIKKYKQR
jgi:4-hydroxy-4-methyl-2-oxoglutarate aldolase